MNLKHPTKTPLEGAESWGDRIGNTHDRCLTIGSKKKTGKTPADSVRVIFFKVQKIEKIRDLVIQSDLFGMIK